MAIPSESFDAIVSLFVLRHLPHPKLAFDEMFRVSKARARIVIAVADGLRCFPPAACGQQSAVFAIEH